MVAPRVYHGEYTLQKTVILTQLNLNIQARDLERMTVLTVVCRRGMLALIKPVPKRTFAMFPDTQTTQNLQLYGAECIGHESNLAEGENTSNTILLKEASLKVTSFCKHRNKSHV